ADPLAAPTRAMRAYCGWHVAPVDEETVTLDGTGTDTLLLPSRLVVDVTRVNGRGEELAERSYEWSTICVQRRLGRLGPASYGPIEVDIKHGFTDMSVLADVVSSIAARAKLGPTGVLASQRAGTQYVGFHSGATGGGLMASEKDRLSPYKLNWGP